MSVKYVKEVSTSIIPPLLLVFDVCLQEEGVKITVNSVHPGVIMTPLMRHSSYLMRMLILLKTHTQTTKVIAIFFLCYFLSKAII